MTEPRAPSTEQDSGLSIGDRADGVEITGPLRVAGLSHAYEGSRQARSVSVLGLAGDLAQSSGVTSGDRILAIDKVVRYGGGSAAVIDVVLRGETLDHWLTKAGSVTATALAERLLPVIEALGDAHRSGQAHGQISAQHIIVSTNGDWLLLPALTLAGAGAAALAKQSAAPETLSGEPPRPVSDIFSLSAIIYRAITGHAPPSAEERLTSQARQDDDPLVDSEGNGPVGEQSLRAAIDKGLRLHPAVRPQSIDAVRDALKALADEAPATPPELPPAVSHDLPSSTPPPLPKTEPSGQSGPWSSESAPKDAAPQRPRSVPNVRRKTSTIGQAPRPPAGTKPKRPIKKTAILTFLIAGAIAWMVSSGGFGVFNDTPGDLTPPPQERPVERNVEQVAKPPSNESQTPAANEDEAVLDRVRLAWCSSQLTFEQARDDGQAALRRYIDRCTPVDGEFIDQAQDALGQ